MVIGNVAFSRVDAEAGEFLAEFLLLGKRTTRHAEMDAGPDADLVDDPAGLLNRAPQQPLPTALSCPRQKSGGKYRSNDRSSARLGPAPIALR